MESIPGLHVQSRLYFPGEDDSDLLSKAKLDVKVYVHSKSFVCLSKFGRPKVEISRNLWRKRLCGLHFD